MPGHPQLSIRRQCELLGLGRANWYYQSTEEGADTLELMRHIDQQYTRTPFYGSRRLPVYLNGLGYAVNRKRVQRLMRLMGLAGVVPGPHMSRPHPTHAIYPYLLRDLVVERPNQVWCTDVTYIPMQRGFMFLVAILGLVEPLCRSLGGLKHAGYDLLPSSPGAGVPPGVPRDLQ